MSSITSVSATSGIFNIQTASGETKSLSFGELMMSMGMMQLELQDAYFEEQYQKASQMAEEMRAVNDYVALLTKLKGYFKSDGTVQTNLLPGHENRVATLDPADEAMYVKLQKQFSDKFSGELIGKNQNSNRYHFRLNENVLPLLTNAEAYQKNLSSLNEQQMMVTNQAASRRSNVLQQLQTLLASEKEGRSAATR